MTPRTDPLTAPSPSPGAATDRGELTRRRILDVAALAFAEEGYAGTSLNEVIRRSGLTKGAVYFHFSSKEDLALEVFRFKQEQWAGKVMAAAMREPRAIDQLTAMVRALFDLQEQDPSARAFANLCMDHAAFEALASASEMQMTTWVRMTADVLRRGQQEGDVRPDIDPEAAAEVAVGAFIGIEQFSEQAGDRPGLRRRGELLLDLLMRATVTDATTTEGGDRAGSARAAEREATDG